MEKEGQKIRKILVPLDGSENSKRGLDAAIHLAKEHSASILAIYVVHKLPDMAGGGKKVDMDTPPFIIQAKKLAEKQNLSFSSRILSGDPGHSIIEYSNTRDVDLIVIGARGRGTFKKIFLGSVSNYVLHKSKAAVMLIK